MNNRLHARIRCPCVDIVTLCFIGANELHKLRERGAGQFTQCVRMFVRCQQQVIGDNMVVPHRIWKYIPYNLEVFCDFNCLRTSLVNLAKRAIVFSRIGLGKVPPVSFDLLAVAGSCHAIKHKAKAMHMETLLC